MQDLEEILLALGADVAAAYRHLPLAAVLSYFPSPERNRTRTIATQQVDT